ncbi:MAG: phosphoglucomutase (alpha-D-glucose-1,6-bisphosphate-dependent) [Thermodesulfobacteriota bacterium]
MNVHPLAGKPAPRANLVNLPRLISAYYTEPPAGPVSFGTSGHRGTSLDGGFNEAHIAAATQAICDYRRLEDVGGPLFLGFDTHALSEPAFRTCLEILAANDVETVIHKGDEYTPTPVISFLILTHNRGRTQGLADGIVITPSHNPPRDGGLKYNPPNGGPADVEATSWIQNRANELMKAGGAAVKRKPYHQARRSAVVHERDFIAPFIQALPEVVDLKAIREARIKIGVDPLGGSGVHFWGPIAETYGLNLEVVNPDVDPAFGFMPLDADGEIRMDCSSPYAMANLIALADRFDVAWGNDPDYDRHGIVCPSGLMNPNHYLAVAVWYLIQNRPAWRPDLKIGKTLVSSSMIDRVTRGLGRELYEVPVGFKWFVPGLLDGTLALGGEESAGAAFLRRDGSAWSTDKDGFSLTLLAAEILARTGRNPADVYREILVPRYGEPYYQRVDAPITDRQKAALKALQPDSIKAPALAGQPISAVMTTAPGNGAAMGGVKVVLADGSWFALRPSGTEPKMKLYIESYGGRELWERLNREASPLVFGE